MKILTIGNSFTWSLRSCFRNIVESCGREVQLEFANFGGCELRRHWGYITAEENEPCCRMYLDYTTKLRDLLASEKWDVVTIQQASHESWDYSTYTPYAGLIIDYIRHYAPGAKVVIQQTWAYREDSPRFAVWGFDRKEMYRRLDSAYRQLAADHDLDVIPSGKGVELALENQGAPVKSYPPELRETLRWPDLPPQANSIVGNAVWRKNAAGELFLSVDSIHLNIRGEYLQGCIWYGKLFGADPREVTYVHGAVADRDAEFLRRMAYRALNEY